MYVYMCFKQCGACISMNALLLLKCAAVDCCGNSEMREEAVWPSTKIIVLYRHLNTWIYHNDLIMMLFTIMKCELSTTP
jgi:hypothetical protein